jgi:endonuclease YncB( thermonuclease family)
MGKVMPLARGLKAILVLVFLLGLAALLRERWDQPISGAARAIDGDSLQVGDRELRLTGIDAPELRQTCGPSTKPWPCGKDARQHLAVLLRRANPVCTIEGEDRYQRSLAQCHVAGADVAAAMVKAGLAIATDAYFSEEAEAKTAKRAIWSGPFERPRDFRKSNGSAIE